jgi:hypothetical protein
VPKDDGSGTVTPPSVTEQTTGSGTGTGGGTDTGGGGTDTGGGGTDTEGNEYTRALVGTWRGPVKGYTFEYVFTNTICTMSFTGENVPDGYTGPMTGPYTATATTLTAGGESIPYRISGNILYIPWGDVGQTVEMPFTKV